MTLYMTLSSLKTFTWSFFVGYKPAMLSAVALDEESARADLLRLLKDITEKNKIYAPLQKRSYEISTMLWKHREGKKEIENSLRALKFLEKDIDKTNADLLALEKEQNECLDETNYLVYGKTLSERKRELERWLKSYQTQLKKFETEEILQRKIDDFDSQMKILELEDTEVEKKLKEIRESIQTNDLTGPYTLCPIEFTLEYETGSGETIEKILSGPASESKPFYNTTIFSALDG